MTARLPATVGVFEPIYNGGLPYVGVDDVAGARKLIDLLLAEGHRKIAFIGDSRTVLPLAAAGRASRKAWTPPTCGPKTASSSMATARSKAGVLR